MTCLTLLRPHRLWLGWLAALPCAATLAQPLADPTRPPADRLPPHSASNAPAANSTGLRLIISSPQRQLVLYNGQLVRRGDVLEGSTLTQVDARAIRLRKDDQRQQVSMHPLVQKIPRLAPALAQSTPDLPTRETR